jgi:glycosyltransferase involved in cell wall biosynthesis
MIIHSFPLISVVIASYNHSPFILQALDSVVAQTYPNIELVVVDDCSRDDSVAKIKKWAKNPKHKKRFTNIIIEDAKINRGAHNTLNRGAELAHGEFVNFLNSDDFFETQRIEMLMAKLIQHRLLWGFSAVRVVDENNKEIVPVNLPPEVGFVYEGIAHAREHYPEFSCGLLERNFVVSTGNILVQRDVFLRLGGFRDLKYLHDWDFVLRISRESEPAVIDTPLYAYRLHGTNSFKSLANIAAIEGAFVMQEHLAALNFYTFNPTAPSPKNWPVLYDFWIDRLHLRPFVK